MAEIQQMFYRFGELPYLLCRKLGRTLPTSDTKNSYPGAVVKQASTDSTGALVAHLF
jgi:hypothetical protein